MAVNLNKHVSLKFCLLKQAQVLMLACLEAADFPVPHRQLYFFILVYFKVYFYRNVQGQILVQILVKVVQGWSSFGMGDK